MFWGGRKEGLVGEEGGENDPGPWFSPSTPPESIGRNKGEWMLGQAREPRLELASLRVGTEEKLRERNPGIRYCWMSMSMSISRISTSDGSRAGRNYPIEPPFDLRYPLMPPHL